MAGEHVLGVLPQLGRPIRAHLQAQPERAHQRVALFPAPLPQFSPPPLHTHIARSSKTCMPFSTCYVLFTPQGRPRFAETRSRMDTCSRRVPAEATAPLPWWKDWGPAGKEPRREAPPTPSCSNLPPGRSLPKPFYNS